MAFHIRRAKRVNSFASADHLRHRFWTVAVAIGITVTLLTICSPSLPTASAATPPSPVHTMIQACREGDTIVIAARGSGEPANSKYGLGETMWSAYVSMYDEVKNHGFNGQELRVVPVIYEAQPVWSLPFVVNGQNAFFGSIATGVNYTKSLLNDYRSRPECLGHGVILAGYSQGAMVMHRVLHDSGALAGVNVWSPLLVADGDRVAYDNLNRWGGANPGTQGIGQHFRLASGSNEAKLDMFGARDVCAPNDIVCSPNIPPGPWWVKSAALAAQTWVHLQYKNSAMLDRAARAIPR